MNTAGESSLSVQTSHPTKQKTDEQQRRLEGTRLPDFAVLFFDLLVGEYESIKDRPCHDQEAYKLADDLMTAYRTGSIVLTWGYLCEFDRLLLRLRTIDEIKERIPALESRYIEIAEPSAYVDYLRKPVSQADASEQQLRARVDGLVSEFYRFCMMAECRERMRDRKTRGLNWCIAAFLFVFLVCGVINGFIEPHRDPVPALPADTASEHREQVSTSALTANQENSGWFHRIREAFKPLRPLFRRLSGTAIAVMFAGALGGFISAQSRVQRTAKRTTLVDLITLSRGGPFHSTAPINGAVFALILYTMFTAQLLSGTFFPVINTPSGPEPSEAFLRFWNFFILSGPDKGLDWAKVLIWSFVAGFAERFVPDALTRLATTATNQKRE